MIRSSGVGGRCPKETSRGRPSFLATRKNQAHHTGDDMIVIGLQFVGPHISEVPAKKAGASDEEQQVAHDHTQQAVEIKR